MLNTKHEGLPLTVMDSEPVAPTPAPGTEPAADAPPPPSSSEGDRADVLVFDASGGVLQRLGGPERTAEGYVIFSGIGTRAGVYVYRDARGEEVRRLRPWKWVSHPDSLASMQGRPVTWHHPPDLLDTQTTRIHQRGFATDPILHEDEQVVESRIHITDQELLDAIEREEVRELSWGYRVAAYDATPGVWRDIPYDEVQVGPYVYNHLAVVKRARGGSGMRLVAQDGADVPVAEGRWELVEVLTGEASPAGEGAPAGEANNASANEGAGGSAEGLPGDTPLSSVDGCSGGGKPECDGGVSFRAHPTPDDDSGAGAPTTTPDPEDTMPQPYIHQAADGTCSIRDARDPEKVYSEHPDLASACDALMGMSGGEDDGGGESTPPAPTGPTTEDMDKLRAERDAAMQQVKDMEAQVADMKTRVADAANAEPDAKVISKAVGERIRTATAALPMVPEDKQKGLFEMDAASIKTLAIRTQVPTAPAEMSDAYRDASFDMLAARFADHERNFAALSRTATPDAVNDSAEDKAAAEHEAAYRKGYENT